MVKAYGDERRTEISNEEVVSFVDEDLITEEMMVVTVSHQGYIKRTPLDQYRSQGRGGKGVQAGETREGDFLWRICSSPARTTTSCSSPTAAASTGARSTSCRSSAARRAVVRWPTWSRRRSRANASRTSCGCTEFDDRYLITATAKGLIKKTKLEAYSRPKKGRHHRGRARGGRPADRRQPGAEGRDHRARHQATAWRFASSSPTPAPWGAARAACAASS